LKSRASLWSQPERGVRPPALEALFHFKVTGFLQLAHVGGQVAPGQAGLVHEEYEIRAIDHVQQRHDRQPGRFMHQPVQLRERG